MESSSGPALYGLIGYPVKHSLSALMHKAAFDHYKINAEYRLFEVRPEKLEDFLLGNLQVSDVHGEVSVNSREIAGFNITIPHKVRAYEILKKYHPGGITVRTYPYVFLSGAINTVKREENNRIEFQNTDVTGFIRSLKEDLKFDFTDKNIFVFGCGGAGRAVIAGLTADLAGLEKDAQRVGKIYIYDANREAIDSAKTNFDNFEDVQSKLEFISSQTQLADIMKDCQLLVNASPVGMKENDPSIISKDSLHNGLYIYDVVYNRETRLIKDAKSRGLKCVGGLGMLLYQGVAALKLWISSREVSTDVIELMRQALLEGL